MCNHQNMVSYKCMYEWHANGNDTWLRYVPNTAKYIWQQPKIWPTSICVMEISSQFFFQRCCVTVVAVRTYCFSNTSDGHQFIMFWIYARSSYGCVKLMNICVYTTLTHTLIIAIILVHGGGWEGRCTPFYLIFLGTPIKNCRNQMRIDS